MCVCVLTLSSGWWRGPFCVLRTSESCGTYTVFTVKVKLIIPLFFILITIYIAEQLGFCTDHRVTMI
jgi:hypothetical protein